VLLLAITGHCKRMHVCHQQSPRSRQSEAAVVVLIAVMTLVGPASKAMVTVKMVASLAEVIALVVKMEEHRVYFRNQWTGSALMTQLNAKTMITVNRAIVRKHAAIMVSSIPQPM